MNPKFGRYGPYLSKMTLTGSTGKDAKLSFVFSGLDSVKPVCSCHLFKVTAISANRNISMLFAQDCDVPDTAKNEKGALPLLGFRTP